MIPVVSIDSPAWAVFLNLSILQGVCRYNRRNGCEYRD